MKDPYYPDDIRQYDNDPRSPFYDDGGEEKFREEKFEEIIRDPEWVMGFLADMDESDFKDILLDVDRSGVSNPDRQRMYHTLIGKAIAEFLLDKTDEQVDIEWETRND